MNHLLAQHDGLIRLVASRQWLEGLLYQEPVQVGCCGLWRAILGYDQ